MPMSQTLGLTVILSFAAVHAAGADGPWSKAEPLRPGQWTPTDYSFEAPSPPSQQIWDSRTSQTRQVSVVQDMAPPTPGGGNLTIDGGPPGAMFRSLATVGNLTTLLGPRGSVDPAAGLTAGANGGSQLPAAQQIRQFGALSGDREPGGVKQLGLASHNAGDSTAPQAAYANPRTYQIISAGPDGTGKSVVPANTRAVSNVQSYDPGSGATRRVIGGTK